MEKTNKKSNCCHKCNQIIYEKDKFGPVNSNIYHKSCFKCFICDSSLTLKSYTTSQANINDKEVYCTSHAPRANQMQRGMKIDKANDNSSAKENASKIKCTTSEEDLLNTINNNNKSTSIINNVNMNRRLSNALVTQVKPANPTIVMPIFNEGKVTMLTRKWNSRESLLDSSQKTATSQNQHSTSKKHEQSDSANPVIEINSTSSIDNQVQEITGNRSPKGMPRQYSTSPKFIVDDLGGGISYSKYMEEIKRRQHSSSEQKRNVTDLYLKNMSPTKKCGSTGDILQELASRPNEKEASTKNRLNVNDLINDELNFYKSFNNASRSLNKDLDKYDSRQSMVSSKEKLTTNNRYIAKNYDEEILEKILADKSKTQITDDNAKIIVDFKSGGLTSNVHVQNSSSILIKTLSRDEVRRNDTIYSYTMSNRSSCENLTETRDVYPESVLQGTKAREQEVIEKIGSLMISYMFRNNEFFITVQGAKNLLNGKERPLDTYVTIKILPDPRKQTASTTNVAENTCNPEWNQTFVYGISYSAIKTKYIYISIKDHKMASKLQSELSESLQYEALKLISFGEYLICLNDIRENVYYEKTCSLQEPSDVQESIRTKDL